MPDTSSGNIWSQHAPQLAGVWKCISFIVYSDTTETKEYARPHGDNPLGRVQISQSGYLSAHMANPDRIKPLPSGKPWQRGEDAEVAHVARGHSMYCGQMELFEDAEGLWWRTKVDVITDAAKVGGYEVRRAQIREENGKVFMTLRPEKDMVAEVGSEVP